jgi:hypothetical protein
MTLRVVGAGVGRTGTNSLKFALEKLLGGPCYHMIEVFPRPEHVAQWRAAINGDEVDFDALLDGFVAAVDWPACTVWRELSEANPDAMILLSTRDPEAWWTSCDRTIWEVFRTPGVVADDWRAMATDMLERFGPDFLSRESAIAAYERHNADVRATADPKRLVEWHPGDGWEPICSALGVDVPDEPFPHVNSTKEFRDRAGWD